MDSGETVIVTKDDGCECGSDAYDTSPTQGFAELHNQRKQDACKHQMAVANAEPLGECPNCERVTVVAEDKFTTSGSEPVTQHLYSEFYCVNCGERLSR